MRNKSSKINKIMIILILFSVQLCVSGIELNYVNHNVPGNLVLTNEKILKINLIEHYLQINFIYEMINIDIQESMMSDMENTVLGNKKNNNSKELQKSADNIEKYMKKIVDLTINKKEDYKDTYRVGMRILSLDLNPDSIQAFLLYPLISQLVDDQLSVFLGKSYENLKKLKNEIKDYLNTRHFIDMLNKLDVKDSDLITLCQVEGDNVKVIYYNRSNGSVFLKRLSQGAMLGDFKCVNVSDKQARFYDSNKRKFIDLNYLEYEQDKNLFIFNEIKKDEYNILNWFENLSEFDIEESGNFNLYLKVVDPQGKLINPSQVKIDNEIYSSDSNGMITINFDTSSFNESEKIITVVFKGKKEVKRDFKLKIIPRKINIGFGGGSNANAGIGGEVPFALNGTLGAQVGLGANVNFYVNDITDLSEDFVEYSFNKKVGVSAGLDVGPEWAPIETEILGRRAGVRGGVSGGLGVEGELCKNAVYKYVSPYSNYLNEQALLFASCINSANIMGNASLNIITEDMKRSFISNHLSHIGYGIGAGVEAGIKAGVGAGLVTLNEKGKVKDVDFGVSTDVIDIKSKISSSFELGIETNCSTSNRDDKTSLVFQLNGEANLVLGKYEFLFSGIMKDILPNWWKQNINGIISCSISGTFDQKNDLEETVISFSIEKEVKDHLYDEMLTPFYGLLMKKNAESVDYSELNKIKGVCITYNFTFDKKQSEKYFKPFISLITLYNNGLVNMLNNKEKIQLIMDETLKNLNDISEERIAYSENTKFILEKIDMNLLKGKVKALGAAELGLSFNVLKTKSFLSKKGYVENLKTYPVEEYNYSDKLAQTDRSLNYLTEKISDNLYSEFEKGGQEILIKTRAGVVYVMQTLNDGGVYVLKVVGNQVDSISKYVGPKADELIKYSGETYESMDKDLEKILENAYKYWVE